MRNIMPVKISIEADSIDMVQAMLIGMTRAIAEETGPAVLSDQAPSDIVQQTELPLQQPVLTADAEPAPATGNFPESLRAGLNTVFPPDKEEPEPQPEQKKRGRKPKLVAVPEPIEDVEPPPEVITEEDEPEAEGAVDKDDPAPETTGVSEAQLRASVREIMDEFGIPAALKLLAKGGYKHVKDIPPADYDRIYAILQKGVSHAE
jgi:hypothetical protein